MELSQAKTYWSQWEKKKGLPLKIKVSLDTVGSPFVFRRCNKEQSRTGHKLLSHDAEIPESRVLTKKRMLSSPKILNAKQTARQKCKAA